MIPRGSFIRHHSLIVSTETVGGDEPAPGKTYFVPFRIEDEMVASALCVEPQGGIVSAGIYETNRYGEPAGYRKELLAPIRWTPPGSAWLPSRVDIPLGGVSLSPGYFFVAIRLDDPSSPTRIAFSRTSISRPSPEVSYVPLIQNAAVRSWCWTSLQAPWAASASATLEATSAPSIMLKAG